MRKAIFPGTFDPFTIGHYSVVERALTFMDEIIIGIGINENKNTYFPIEKREEMIRNLYKDNPRIKVMSYDCLTIDFDQHNSSFAASARSRISSTRKRLPTLTANWRASKPSCSSQNRN